MTIDSSDNTNTCAFTIQVKGAAEQINDLIALVNSLRLRPGTANALLPKLQRALRQLSMGKTREACHHLKSFIREVNNKLNSKQISAAQANQLLTAANRIRAVLGCP
jgi:mevalonate kinase